MEKVEKTISLRNAALIAGTTILIMAIVAPFAEIFVYPKLIVSGNAKETFTSVLGNKKLFSAAIFAYAATFAGDILVSWALYILLKPVNAGLSLLTALFRLTFTIISLVGLVDLVTVFRLVGDEDYLKVVDQQQLSAQVYFLLHSFRYGYHFGILFFSFHLGLLGYLVAKSEYIPRILGVILIISAGGFLTSALKPFLFPQLNTSFITVTFFGELIFMFWLLFRGSRISFISNKF